MTDALLIITEVMQIVVACYIDYGISTVMRKGVERVYCNR